MKVATLPCCRVTVAVIAVTFLFLGVAQPDERYDFRSSQAYKELSEADREKLEKVHHGMILLWGALDMYADHNEGKLPETLDELAPGYLRRLPKDPFATEATAKETPTHGYVSSRKGWGYRYRKGAPGNRAWVISSVGLPDFPYLAQRGNVGLYICKGTWISGINPMLMKDRD